MTLKGTVKNEELRLACIEAYGKYSAREIADECGVTRNVVIGHWFRARKAGLIPQGEELK